jgi:hypothetical protein
MTRRKPSRADVFAAQAAAGLARHHGNTQPTSSDAVAGTSTAGEPPMPGSPRLPQSVQGPPPAPRSTVALATEPSAVSDVAGDAGVTTIEAVTDSAGWPLPSRLWSLPSLFAEDDPPPRRRRG